MYGGTLDAHREPDDGYAVHAHIPLESGGA
jgi:hypothetical protein